MRPRLRSFAAGVRAWLSMPVLVKELTETAAQRRTYIMRVVYAVALYGIFAVTLPRNYEYLQNGARTHTSLLGFGRELFERLSILQLFGIILFQPALMCDRITQEKERDSLVLLFLTELRPWGIVLQKYLGGLMPMLSFLLLGLPLAGVAYALGGLESRALWDYSLSLLLLAIQVGALSLMLSAWCRTTVAALISTYLVGSLFYLGPPFLASLAMSEQQIPYEVDRLRFLFIPQAAVEFSKQGISVPRIVFFLPCLFSIALFLFLARVFLVRRAFVPPSDFLPRLFARLDRLMKRANRFVGGYVLYRDGASLPTDEPVFWRETQRRALGKPHHLLRLLCAIEIPTVLLCMAVAFSGVSGDDSTSLSIAAAVLGVLAVLSLSATASNSLVSERVGQTLDVLLTTPLSGQQIVRQKERALRRLEWVLAVPLLTVFGCQAFFHADASQATARQWIPYLTCTILLVAIYLPMTTWLSLNIGLRVRTRFRAILTALGTLAFWAALCPIFFIASGPRSHDYDPTYWLFLLSPLTAPFVNEIGEFRVFWGAGGPWPVILINAGLYAAIALFFRRRLFADADRCLRR